MSRARNRVSWAAFWAGTVLFTIAQVIQVVTGNQGHGFFDFYFAIVASAAVVTMLWLGTTIVRRQPGNRIGWLFLALPLVATVWDLGQSLSVVGFDHGAPWTPYVAWVTKWTLVPTFALFVPIFLLFPDGRPPSPRWRPVLWVWAAAMSIATLGFALTPAPLDTGPGFVRNPLGLTGLRPVIDAITQVAGFGALLSAFATGVAVVMRFRRSRGDERAQLKWLALVAVAFLVTFGTAIAVFTLGFEKKGPEWVGGLIFAVFSTILILGLPLACAIAILKYRLYDIDVVIRKTVVFGLLAAFIALLYAAVVGGVGALVGSRASPALSFVAAAALALLFQPAREQARRVADRLVYGKRATPYEVLTEFSGRMAESYATDDVLPRMAQILRAGTGADSAAVWLDVASELRPLAVAPEGAEAPHEHVVEVRHQGELLGELSVRMPASDPMNPAKAKLISDLASQAGLVLRNVKLIEELRASRKRLVAAQDEERRRIERDLHDGAQQQLVALSVQLKLADALVGKDAERERELLGRLRSQAAAALDELRDLARGIYPPLLADRGLPAALGAQAARAAVPTAVDTDGVGRYPREVESAVYFCCLEALNNVAKYADASSAKIRLRADADNLTFEVTDDGVGFDASAIGYGTGLQGMADRLDAIGGELDVTSAPGAGTAIRGRVTAHGVTP